MKLGLFTYSYHLSFGAHDVYKPAQPMTLEACIDHCVELGFRGMQIDPMHYQSLDESYLRAVGERLRRADLYVEHGAWGVDEQTLRQAIHHSQLVGASLFRTALGFTRYDPGIDVQKRLAEARRSLLAVKPEAEAAGVSIAIENHCDATTDELIALIEAIDSPNIGVCVDPGNFMIYLEDPVTSIARLAPYILTIHLKDYAASMENYGFKYFGVPLGEGVIDLAGIMEILRRETRLKYVMLEVPVEQEADEQATREKEEQGVQRSIAYARANLGIQ